MAETRASDESGSLASQSAWLLFAKVVGFGVSFALPLLIVRLLSKEEFGLYRQAFVVVATATSILPLGVGMSAFYYLTRDESTRHSAIFNILLFYFAVGAVAFGLLFFFPTLLGNVFDSLEMARISPLIGVLAWVWIFSMFLETVAVANREARLSSAFIIFAQLSKSVFLITAVLWFDDVVSILYAAIVQGLMQTVILIFYLANRFPGFWRYFDWTFFKEHLAYALPFGLAGLFWVAQTDLHFYFVGSRFSVTDFAIYAVGCFQIPLLSLLSESVASVMIPRMSELRMKNEPGQMVDLFVRASNKLAFFYFPAYVFFLIAGGTMITTLFTDEYAASVPIFLIFLTTLPIAAFIFDPIVRSSPALGRFLLKLRIVTTIILIAALYFGVQYLGLPGIIAIVVAVQVGEKFCIGLVCLRSIGTKLSDLAKLGRAAKILFISAAAALPTVLAFGMIGNFSAGLAERALAFAKPAIVHVIGGMLTLWISFLVFSAVYLLLALWFDLIDGEDKERVQRLFKRKILRRRAA